MREEGAQRVSNILTDGQSDRFDVAAKEVEAQKEARVTARIEWHRQMRLQSMVWGHNLALHAKESDGQVAVKNAEEIFKFLTKEDVN